MIKIDISDIYKPYTSTTCSVIYMYVKQHWNKYKIRYEKQSKNIKYMVHLFVNMPKNNWTFDFNITYFLSLRHFKLDNTHTQVCYSQITSCVCSIHKL